MKKLLLVASLIVSITTGLRAQEAAAPAPAPAAPATPAAVAPAGEKMAVVFVGANKISVKPGNGKDKSIESTKYAVTPETKITINGEPAQLTQIKPGHKVIITAVAGQPDVAATISMTKKSAQ